MKKHLQHIKLKLHNIKSDLCFLNKHKELYRQIQRNRELKNLYSGQRCFIIGNGPSVNNQNLGLLENEFVITVNQFPRNRQFEKVRTNCHVWADSSFFQIDQSKPEDAELLSIIKNVSLYSNPLIFYEAEGYELIHTIFSMRLQNVRFFLQNRQKDYQDKHMFDLTKGIPHFSTVIHSSICIALYLGFKEIYLLGCDCTNLVNIIETRSEKRRLNIRYSYEITPNELTRMIKNTKKISVKDEIYAQYIMIEDYECLYQYCKAMDVVLSNATLGGILDGIPRVNFGDLF